MKFTRKMVAVTVMIVFCLAVGTLIGGRGWALAAAIAPPDPLIQESEPFDQQQKLQELKKRLAGQENKPAEEVFKNIQVLKGVPAGRLLAVMEMGYARSLGVKCTHCHVTDQWEKDDKSPKNITRDMAAMVRTINTDLLKKIKNLKSENPIVNCTTCHRGQVKPALNLQ